MEIKILGFEEKRNGPEATPALAGVASPGERSNPANFADSSPGPVEDPAESDVRDISKILFGAAASTGKAVFAAGRMTAGDSIEARHQKEIHDRQAQEARELANLAKWNAQMTTVAGVQMTNEQAQAARQRFIDNEDLYADRAVQEGYIKAEDKEALKEGMRRKVELEDKAGRGTITEAERKQLNDWDQSRLGQAGDRVTADMFRNQGVALDAKTQQADSSALMKSDRGTSAARSDDIFATAPNAKSDFQQVAATTPPAAAEPAIIPPPSRKVSASGLDV